MILGIRLKRVLTGVLVALSGVFLLSCGGYSSTTNPPSGLKFRVFVSQDVTATAASPGLIIVNAQLDQLAPISGISAGPSPGLMAVPANNQLTMVFNASDNEVNVISNAKETSNGKVILPSSTQSMAVTSDATLGFAAVPEAPVAGLAPGEVELINLSTTALEAPVPNCAVLSAPISNCLSGARYLVLSPDNTHLLVFGDNATTFVVVTLTNIGTTSAPNWMVSGTALPTAGPSSQLDHPVWAVFSQDGATAYILSCGAECGGTTASITPLSFGANNSACQRNCLGASTVLPGGASYAATFGSTVYVAGSVACLATGADPTSCGKLSILNTAGTAVQLVKTATITDGYHNRMAVTSDNQVFIGAQGCTNVSTSGGRRGCLSLYNSSNGNVVIGTDTGDVTGIQPLSGRPQVYVVENGEIRNWSTLTDTLAPPQQQMDIVGQAIDVKLVD
jgi:hypothetical protein